MKGVNVKISKIKAFAALTAMMVSTASLSGCTGLPIPAGTYDAGTQVTAATTIESSETTAVQSTADTAATSASSSENKPTESRSSAVFSAETVKAKTTALKNEQSAVAIGTTYFGECENEAVLEVVLAELGVDEELLKDTSRLIDCGGTDIWFLCFSDDVTSVKVLLGDDENGKEMYSAANPGYIFIRGFSSGEVPPCTVLTEGKETGKTTYYPYLIGGDIVIPGSGTVLNQSDGYNSYVDVPEETDESNDTEEEEP